MVATITGLKKGHQSDVVQHFRIFLEQHSAAENVDPTTVARL